MKRKKRIRVVLWSVAMILSCGIIILMQDIMNEQLRAKCTHLKEYPYFKNYNQNHYFNDFVISETWRDGFPFYKLSMYEEGITIEIDRNETEAKVIYHGEEVTFPVNGFISTNANIYLADLTGDGSEEVIYEEPMSGADGHVGTCVVVDLRNMRLLKQGEQVPALAENISVETVSQEGEKILCKVTDANHHIYFGNISCNRLEQGMDYIESNDYYAVEFDRVAGKLKAYTCFTLNGCDSGSFLGDISTYYEYNQNTKEFELEDNYVVTLWEPINVAVNG